MRKIFESMSSSTPVERSTLGCSGCDAREGGSPKAPSGLLLLLLAAAAAAVEASCGRMLVGGGGVIRGWLI